jgi:hypothetical protein
MLMQGPGGPGWQWHSIPWPAGATACLQTLKRAAKRLPLPRCHPSPHVPPPALGRPTLQHESRAQRSPSPLAIIVLWYVQGKGGGKGKGAVLLWCGVVGRGVVRCSGMVRAREAADTETVCAAT